MVKKKILGMVLLMFVFSALFVNATELSNQDLDYVSGLNTQENENKLTSSMWSALLDKLSGWLGNHEMRIRKSFRSAGIVSQYKNLSESQMSFDSLVPKQNLLTAEMRNTLLNKLTFSITNHEMRLRELNGLQGSEGMCRGTYVVYTGELVDWSRDDIELRCYSRDHYSPGHYSNTADGDWVARDYPSFCGVSIQSHGLLATKGIGCFVWSGDECKDKEVFSSVFYYNGRRIPDTELTKSLDRWDSFGEHKMGFIYSGEFVPLARDGGGCAKKLQESSKDIVFYPMHSPGCSNLIYRKMELSCANLNKDACMAISECSRYDG